MPAPLELSCDMVRFAVPVFVTVTVCDFVCPSTRLPKLRLAGETLIPGCTPVPDKLKPGAAPGASLTSATVPPALAVAGAVTSRSERNVSVRLPGGVLDIEYCPDGHVFMTGPAEIVYEGEFME